MYSLYLVVLFYCHFICFYLTCLNEINGDGDVSFGTTVNICAVDLSKASNKMNHDSLFIKLMERKIPVNLLLLFENWFAVGVTCVKWGSILSRFIGLGCGIRQCGVLSSYFFALYIDNVVKKVNDSKLGCYMKWVCTSILLYADDILLVAPSVTSLQQLPYCICANRNWTGWTCL